MDELLQKFQQIKLKEDLDDIDLMKEELKKCNSRLRECNTLYYKYIELAKQWKLEKQKSAQSNASLDTYAEMNSDLNNKISLLQKTQTQLKLQLQKKNDTLDKAKIIYLGLQKRYNNLKTSCSRLCKC